MPLRVERTPSWVVGKENMKKIITVAEIKLRNGSAAYAVGRTVMSETNLPANTKIQYIKEEGRPIYPGERNPLHTNSLYRIVDTDDLLVIRHLDGDAHNPIMDNVELRCGYFKKKREYGQAVAVLAKKYSFPYDVALALGTTEEVYPLLSEAIENSRAKDLMYTFEDLKGSTSCQKSFLLIIASELYHTLSIEKMGKKNVWRIAKYVYEQLSK